MKSKKSLTRNRGEKVSILTKEQFRGKCDNDIKLMSKVSGLSYEECADAMFITYKSFDIDDKRVDEIIDKLSKVEI
jgi:hypothetical protein